MWTGGRKRRGNEGGRERVCVERRGGVSVCRGEGGGVSLGHTGVSLVSKVVHLSRLAGFLQVPQCPTDINDVYCIHLEVL